MSLSVYDDFLDFNGHIWLNAASEGPLPKISARALNEAIIWKSKPYLLDNAKFSGTVVALKESIGRLINVEPRDVILGNSASYGIHILANGFKWQKGDEICLMQNDFPTDILPWLALEKMGVKVIQIKPENKILSPAELLAHVSPKTKLVCLSQVHTFTGYILEIKEFAKICKKHNIIFVLNLSQSAGSMPVDVKDLGADAVVCAGYKWLLGPYGTGFCWIDPALRDQLDLNVSYWISALSSQELQTEDALKFKESKGARKYDVFGTANFFNFVPFKASIDYLMERGLENIFAYDQNLIDTFIADLDLKRYQLISPQRGKERSCLVVISHKDKLKNQEIFKKLTTNQIHTAFWKGHIRLSAHIYNSKEEILKVCKFLNNI